MEYIKKEQGAYNLHIIKTKLYKTITVKLYFKEQVEKENITKRNFLARIMMLSTKDYPTKVELTKAEQNLYAANISGSTRRLGNYLDTSISLRVLNDKYTEENNFKKSLELLSSIIFNPNVTNNAFNEREFNIVYEEYKSDLNTIKEDKRTYSLIRCLENTSTGIVGYRGIGYLEDLEKITPQNLYEYYQKVINNNAVDIFVLGDVDEKEISNLFRTYFKNNVYKKPPVKAIVSSDKPRKIKEIKETIPSEQDNLVITLSLNDLTSYERNYPLSLLNTILGGGTESLLFNEVREKSSLAYTISSTPNKLDNLIIIRGGITKGKTTEAISIIKKILKSLAAGKITEEMIARAKEYYISALDDIVESTFQIIESYYMIELLKVDDIETKRKKIKEVTKEEIINVAKKIKINTIYILEGSDNLGKNWLKKSR